MVSLYTIDIPDERLATIRAKVKAYDWSQLPDAGGWTSGVGINDLKRLVAYWRDVYDWRKVERRLNQLPNFTTDIEGERIHFVHVRGDGSKPPLLLLHGWPGSFLEFERLLDPLAADGHDVVVPSLPGFAFSRPITGIIGPRRAAELMHALMVRLFGQRATSSRAATGEPHRELDGLPAAGRACSASTSTWSTSSPRIPLRQPPKRRIDLQAGRNPRLGDRLQPRAGDPSADPRRGDGRQPSWGRRLDTREVRQVGRPAKRPRTAARTSGASFRRSSCSPISCSMSRRRRL